MKSSNPVLAKAFDQNGSRFLTGERMTVSGAVNKTGLLLTIALATAAWPWSVVQSGNLQGLMPMIMGGMIAGLVLSLAIVFKPHWAAICAPIYAACQGLALGAISAMLEASFPGIALQAMVATFGTLGVMLLAYRAKVVRATENFKLGVIAATGGVALIYLASMIASLFGVTMPVIHENGTFGIIFSLAVVVIAALNLVLDFDLIEQGAEAGAPKYMEWVGAFALMVTLVWLYLEMLKLLAKVRGRD